MKYLLLLTLLFISTAFSAKVTNPKKVPRNAALLSKISAITVRAGKQTASRRVSPVPQLKCVGPAKICSLYSIDSMRCTNEGVDYDESNVQWSCKAALPDEFKLGSTDVTCEGYESSEDPYVLKGSCGVEYRLLLTDKGEEKYGSQMGGFNFGGLPKTSSESIAGYAFMALFALVLFIILRGLYKAWRDNTVRPRPRGGGFGGWGGGNGGDDDPPPPYDPRPPPRPKKATWTSGSSSASSSTRQAGANQEQGWRPGFWTGAGAGAAAAYMVGRGARTQPEPPRRAPWEGGLFGGRRDEGPRQGGWFGGGGGGGAAQRSSSRTTSSSPSFSSTRHESTGFGGTSRR